jgi:hypothetical protein
MEGLRAHVSEEAAEKERHPGYFKGGAEHLRTLVSYAGFRNVGVKGIMAYSGPVGTLEELISVADNEEFEPDTRASIIHELREAMQPYDMGRKPRWPRAKFRL